MKKIQKRYIVSFSLFLILLLLIASLFLFYQNKRRLFPRMFPLKTGDIHVFGKPNAKADLTFPAGKPAFTAHVASLNSSSLKQQSVTVYRSGEEKQSPVFQRQFYADGFHGKVLTYVLASDSASIRQSGSLSTIGCGGNECALPWSNFYVWDVKEHAFVLDNASHKEFFQQLLISYQTTDSKGCSLMGANTEPSQTGITLTELYAKYPMLSWYCSKSQGILPSSLQLFLKTKKAVQEVIDGKNIGSADIQNSSL